jgi:hypothetical protein
MIEVVWDEQDGQKRKPVCLAATEQFNRVKKLRGENWVSENYSLDKALEDFIIGSWGWLEWNGIKLRAN